MDVICNSMLDVHIAYAPQSSLHGVSQFANSIYEIISDTKDRDIRDL